MEVPKKLREFIYNPSRNPTSGYLSGGIEVKTFFTVEEMEST
jgi:hypothetical protein